MISQGITLVCASSLALVNSMIIRLLAIRIGAGYLFREFQSEKRLCVVIKAGLGSLDNCTLGSI